MQIHSVGIDMRQDHLLPGSTRRSWQGSRSEEVLTATPAGVHREHADVADRFGSLFWSAFSGPCLA